MKLPALEKAKGGTGRSLPKVFGKTVFLRADLDVPLSENGRQKTDDRTQRTEDRKIEDDTRLKAALPTIEYLLKHGAKVIIAGHLGRPEGIDKSLSLEPVAYWLQGHLEQSERSQWDFSSPSAPRNDKNTLRKTKISKFDGWQLTDKLFLLENLRFYEGEENPSTRFAEAPARRASSGQEFARKLSSLADIYVNDAFAVSHRAHASIVSVPKYLPHYAGLHLQKEIKVLSGVLENPKRPLVVIVGGAKIETKLPLVEKMRDFADYVLVGGKIAKEITPFLKEKSQTLLVADLNPDGFDITPKSVDDFLKIINTAATIVWNGPVGNIDIEEDRYGSTKLAQGILKSKAYTIVGGGDTLGFLKNLSLLDKFSFVSTGGGAMLEFLSGKKLPGLIALLL